MSGAIAAHIWTQADVVPCLLILTG